MKDLTQAQLNRAVCTVTQYESIRVYSYSHAIFLLDSKACKITLITCLFVEYKAANTGQTQKSLKVLHLSSSSVNHDYMAWHGWHTIQMPTTGDHVNAVWSVV